MKKNRIEKLERLQTPQQIALKFIKRTLHRGSFDEFVRWIAEDPRRNNPLILLPRELVKWCTEQEGRRRKKGKSLPIYCESGIRALPAFRLHKHRIPYY